MKPNQYVFALISVLLLSFFAFHGYGLTFGESAHLDDYLNFLSKQQKGSSTYPFWLALKCVGVLSFFAASLFFISLVKKEHFNGSNQYTVMRYAIFIAILSIALFGAIVRIHSNQQGAANLFFFTTLLYMLLFHLNNQASQSLLVLKDIYLLPWYAVLIYTMGVPGWAKIFGGESFRIRYIEMFESSFISSLPGGTSMTIILIGIFELVVPILLLVSLIRGEFLQRRPKLWLTLAMTIIISTFSILCLGLSILLNFAGSSNLVFYSIFTLMMFLCILNKPAPLLKK
ncbi:MAG: hypothetical protein LBF27_33100 [Sphingobacterium sp.]|jgi:hypothetical protein|nr:hypothetical protein [Sphingobacterium sp.]